MQIRRPRGVTVPQLMVVTAIGFLGGVYIWKPLIIKWKNQENTKTVATDLKSSDTTLNIQKEVPK